MRNASDYERDELTRYDRQIILPQIGMEGQLKIRDAKVLIVGAGELLTGKMYVLDGLSMNSRIVKFPNRNDKCPMCGEDAGIKNVMDNWTEYQIKSCSRNFT